MFKGCDILIFASDLDRTLIYSRFFLTQEIENTTVVETRNEKSLSHMTQKAIDLLKLISERLLFVPTTTRSYEQYCRIELFQKQIRPQYAVIANGGIILCKDKVDMNWDNIIRTKAHNLPKPDEIINKCSFFFDSDEISSFRSCDDLFVYSILKGDTVDQEAFNKASELCKGFGYEVVRNSRKIYIIPKFINKWEAVKYIMESTGHNKLAAAGDSLLDLPILINSSYGIIPVHGELHRLYHKDLSEMKNIHFTKSHGIISSEELLENILQLIA